MKVPIACYCALFLCSFLSAQNSQEDAAGIVRSSMLVLGNTELLESNLSISVIEGLTKPQLRVVRNMIFARHGRAFRSEDLQRFYTLFEWYKVSSTYSDSSLTEVDSVNIKSLLAAEKKESIVALPDEAVVGFTTLGVRFGNAPTYPNEPIGYEFMLFEIDNGRYTSMGQRGAWKIEQDLLWVKVEEHWDRIPTEDDYINGQFGREYKMGREPAWKAAAAPGFVPIANLADYRPLSVQISTSDFTDSLTFFRLPLIGRPAFQSAPNGIRWVKG